MEIRFAQPADVPAILNLLRQVGALHGQGRPDIFRRNAQKYSASQVLAMLDDPAQPIFIAAEGETVDDSKVKAAEEKRDKAEDKKERSERAYDMLKKLKMATSQRADELEKAIKNFG